MDKEEMKAALRDVIVGLVKDDTEESATKLHDVLAAKFKARLYPETQTTDTVDDSETDPDNTDDPDDTDDPDGAE